MRILNVRFKNLNSLHGEWTVDFTCPEYATSGIFAITGPTGAGKSTILDAVCLALYGETPRLQWITQTGNEIMSRHTGECLAEVTFESARGRFRCTWSQHRARKRAGGNLQSPRHEIVRADSGQVLESNLKRVAGAVETATGMNFERFTRSMLLAQGGFAAFLQAPPDQRAPILEQMTGTEIYSRISIGVHRRWNEEKARLEALQAEQSGLKLLNPDEREEMAAQLAALMQEEAHLAVESRRIARQQEWLERRARLQSELEELESQWQECQEEEGAFRGARARLENARRAQALEGTYSRLEVMRNAQENDVRSRDELRQKQQRTALQLEEASRERQRTEAALAAAVDGQQQAGRRIQEMRALDRVISDKGLQGQSQADEVRRLQQQCQRQRGDVEAWQQERRLIAKTLEENQAYLRSYAGDARLVEDFSALEHRLQECRVRERRCRQEELRGQEMARLVERSSGEQTRLEGEYSGRKGEYDAAASESRQREEALAGLMDGKEAGDWRRESDLNRQLQERLQQCIETAAALENSRNKRETLQNRLQAGTLRQQALEQEEARFRAVKADSEEKQAFWEQEARRQARIRDLEDERGQLADGEPCPLCGALEHPYARGNVPVAAESGLHLREAAAQAAWAAERLGEILVEKGGLAKDMERDSAELQSQEAGYRELKDQSREQRVVLARLLALEGIPVPAESEAEPELSAVLQRVQAQGIALEKRLEAMEVQRQQLGQGRQAALACLEEMHEAERRWRQAAAEYEKAQRDLEKQAEMCGEWNRELAGEMRSLERALAAYGVEGPLESGLDGILLALTERRQRWQEHQESAGRHAGRLQELGGLADAGEKLLAQMDGEKQAGEARLEVLEQEQSACREQRRLLFGEMDPDAEERRWQEVVEGVRQERETAGLLESRLEAENKSLAQQFNRLENQVADRSRQLEEDTRIWLLRLNRQGFEAEKEFLPARLPEAELNALAARAGEMDRRREGLQVRQTEKQALLQAEQLQQTDSRDAAELQDQSGQLESRIKAAREKIGMIRGRQDEQEQMQERFRIQAEVIGSQQEECRRFESLHGLIGQADGKKYRNFAQGLTFDMLLAQANRQLEKLSDRYLLVRDEVQPLELMVVDNYQAGEIRSAKNLSGGESFLVSLALALGLSQMASRNVRVDSLFLDEGFGSLDEDALELALDTLAGLQQEGKVIGVISHVPAVKERIGTQIQVMPVAGGRSVLQGPGCQKVS